MLKVHYLIIAIFHLGERQTLDHKVAGSILTGGAMFDSHLRCDVVSLSRAPILVA